MHGGTYGRDGVSVTATTLVAAEKKDTVTGRFLVREVLIYVPVCETLLTVGLPIFSNHVQVTGSPV